MRLKNFAAAAFVPMLLVSFYLLVSRSLAPRLGGSADYVAIIVAAACGSAFVWFSGLPQPWRLASSAAYLPLAAIALYWFSLLFVGAVFGDWL